MPFLSLEALVPELTIVHKIDGQFDSDSFATSFVSILQA